MKLRSTAAFALCAGASFLFSCSSGEIASKPTTGTAGTGGTGRSTGVGGGAGTSAGGSTAGRPGATGTAGTTGGPTGNRGGTTGTVITPGGTTGTGVAGTTGTTGRAGTTGSAGTAGVAGTTGTTTTGAAGTRAPTGVAGTTGSAGTTGTTTTGTAGTRAPTGVAGTTGAGGAATTGRGGNSGATAGTSGATAGTSGTAGAGGGTGGTSTTFASGTIVPLYTDPTDSSWTAIVEAKQLHPKVPVVAIVNPADGPGSSRDSAYTTGIAKLQAVNIQVIGYIATGYASHSITSMESTIDQWKSFYPTLQGIFFDEQSNQAADVAYYKTLSQYAKSQGLSYTVGNPGTDTAEAFIGALDTMLIYESDGVPSTAQMGGWHTKYPLSNFGVIPYATPFNASFVATARKYVGYIYLQNDDLPNPWDSLPPYFADLLAALE